MTELALFSVAKQALAEARKTDEVMDVRSEAVRMRLYGEQAKDRTIIADASEIIARAERKLGELIKSAKETGQLGIGRPARSNVSEPERGDDDNGTPPEPFTRVTLQDAGISKKLSAKSQKLAALDETAFEAAMKVARDKIISGDAVVVNPLKDVSTEGKKAARAKREAELGKKQVALPEAKFGVIYADPEWKFATYSEETGMDRSADNHYPTSDLDAIKKRDVGSLVAADAVLFLWATVPMLPEALEVMAAWGFTYKSQTIWNKDRIGTGFWFRNKHEILLVGTRGKVPAPAMGDQFPSVIDAPVGEHSAKPEKFYEVIEAYFPTLPKIELNARQAREGWVRWGYEAPEENAPATATRGVDDLGSVQDALEMSTDGQPAGRLSTPNTERQVDEVGVTAGETASQLIERALLREVYEGEIVLLAPQKGKMTMKLAEAAMRAGYAAEVPRALMAQDLGHPDGTVATWANRLGLTSLDRMHSMQKRFGSEA